MTWIYLSPHLDDAAYSCGGRIWQQVQAGETVEIWTICAGDPPPGPLSPFVEQIHLRWAVGSHPVAERRAEDARACQVLGARQRLFHLPDCIYRRLPGSTEPFINKDEDLFTGLRPEEEALVGWLAEELAGALPAAAALVSPLTLGGHMDHQLVRQAAESLGRPLWFYPDFPYVVMQKVDLSDWLSPAWQTDCLEISQPGLYAWQDAIAAYRSQLSSFWQDETEMRRCLEDYLRTSQGLGCLWRRS